MLTQVKLQPDPNKYNQKKKSKGKIPVIGEEGEAVAWHRAIDGYREWRLATEVGGGGGAEQGRGGGSSLARRWRNAGS